MTEAGGAILVVDDDPFLRLLLTTQLGEAGYRCRAAADAREARDLLARTSYALMLCDLAMPGESGLELLAAALRADPDLAALVVTGNDDPATADAADRLGAFGYMVKPFSRSQLLINVANALRRRELAIENRAHRERLEELVRDRTAALVEAVWQLERTAEALEASREETILRLSRAGEYRDEETGEHVTRVGRIAHVLASGIGVEPERADAIRIVSPLHDIGKVGIPDAILRKPGPLDPGERAVMERHAEIGHRILTGSDSELLELAATLAWTHHERYDGTGYPRGLAGEEIPVEGRIAAVADVFDALTHDRVYRPRFSRDAALRAMRDGRGTHFAPEVVDVLFASLAEIDSIAADTAADRALRVGGDRFAGH